MPRAASKPDEAAAAGITTADLDRVSAYEAALSSADGAQRNQKRAATASTADRNGAVKDVIAAARVIAAAGALHHHGNAAKVAAYDALRGAAATPRKKRTTDPAPAP